MGSLKVKRKFALYSFFLSGTQLEIALCRCPYSDTERKWETSARRLSYSNYDNLIQDKCDFFLCFLTFQ